MNNKRGQAALEFLTTYGWAFLVILVMIGALAYFGVLDPSRFLPNRCQFAAGLQCEKYVLDSGANEARVKITNNLGDHIYVSEMNYSIDNMNTWNGCGATFSAGAQNKGQTKDYNCSIPTGLIQGSKQKVNLRFTYNVGTTDDPGFHTYALGEVYSEVI